MILANIIESAFSPLIWVFLQVLLGVHAVIGGSWGWSIIGLTLIVRTLTFPPVSYTHLTLPTILRV